MTSIHSQGNRRRARGTTLFELLVVMAVVAVVLGILMPGVLRLRGVADREKCQNNLRQILAAVHGYASANQDRLPPYSKSIPTGPGSAFYWMLPQIGHEDIYRASVNAGGWYGCSDKPVPLYQCSMDLTMHNGMAANTPMTNAQGAPVPIAGSSYALNFRVSAGEDNHTFNLESPTLKGRSGRGGQHHLHRRAGASTTRRRSTAATAGAGPAATATATTSARVRPSQPDINLRSSTPRRRRPARRRTSGASTPASASSAWVTAARA